MISIWHLLWIVPLSGMIGMILPALCSFNERDERKRK
nr:MAG TPA: hypothetical protein [Caudoviricetes sp.]